MKFVLTGPNPKFLTDVYSFGTQVSRFGVRSECILSIFTTCLPVVKVIDSVIKKDADLKTYNGRKSRIKQNIYIHQH